MIDNELTLRGKERVLEGKAKILVLASGGGTNFQEIINRVERKDIDAEIVGLISNNPDAFAITRANNHGIASIVVPSKGRLKDSQKRTEFEKELFDEINKLSPHIIVLAGWMLILSDDFIIKTRGLEAPIINLHPALLTRGNEDFVKTSKGEIRVIRGANAIHEAYEEGLEASGVTVHKVVPGPFDTGPIIAQEEVYRVPGETVEEWENRIHKVEYNLLPAAINKVIFKMKLGIDVSSENFDL